MNIETTKAAIHELVNSTDYEAILTHTHIQFKRFKDIQEAHPERVFTIEELELIDIIKNGLSREFMLRYDELALKFLRREITEKERLEYKEHIEQSEKFAVERLRCIIELSKMWETDIESVMEYLNIQTPEPLSA